MCVGRRFGVFHCYFVVQITGYFGFGVSNGGSILVIEFVTRLVSPQSIPKLKCLM